MKSTVAVFRGVTKPEYTKNGLGRFYTTDVEYAKLYGRYIIESEIDLNDFQCLCGDVYDLHAIVDARIEYGINEPDIDILFMDAGVTPGEVFELYMYSDLAVQAVNNNMV